MTRIMPQEVDVWFVLPSIRRALAGVLSKEYDLKQNEISRILGITEAATSQYLSSKRGGRVRFSPSATVLIRKTAKKIVADKKNVMTHIALLCKELKRSGIACALHKKNDRSVPASCRLCRCR